MNSVELIVISSDEEDDHQVVLNPQRPRNPSGRTTGKFSNDKHQDQHGRRIDLAEISLLKAQKTATRSKSVDIPSAKNDESTKVKRSTSAPCSNKWSISSKTRAIKPTTCKEITPAKPMLAPRTLVAPVCVMEPVIYTNNIQEATKTPPNPIAPGPQTQVLPTQLWSNNGYLKMMQTQNMSQTSLPNTLRLRPSIITVPNSKPNPYQSFSPSQSSTSTRLPQRPANNAVPTPYYAYMADQPFEKSARRPTIPLSQLDPRLHPKPPSATAQAYPPSYHPHQPPYLPLSTQPKPPKRKYADPSPSFPSTKRRKPSSSPPPSFLPPTTTKTTPTTFKPRGRSTRSRPWTAAMLADLATSLQTSFDFHGFGAKHQKPAADVFDVFSAVVQLPLLEYSAKGLARARMKEFGQRMREFKERGVGLGEGMGMGMGSGTRGRKMDGGMEMREMGRAKKERVRNEPREIEGTKGVLELHDGIYILRE